MDGLCRRRIRVGVFRRAGANQVLVIEERAAECALKEVVGEHELLREPVQRRLAVVVVSHGETAGIGPCGVAVVLAAVDLHLVFEEAMGAGRASPSTSTSVTLDCAVKACSIENGALGKPELWASVTTGLMPEAVTPPHVGGRTGSTDPSRSTCGT